MPNDAARATAETLSNSYQQAPFRQVSDMESPLATVHDLLLGLSYIAETLSDDEGSVIQRIAWLGIRECRAVEKLRGELFRVTHPRREHFEKEGWPS